MPITRITFLICCLAIAGIFPFAGFFSKDEILGGAWARGHGIRRAGRTFYGKILWGGLLIAALGTAFYMWRLYFLVFARQASAREEAQARARVAAGDDGRRSSSSRPRDASSASSACRTSRRCTCPSVTHALARLARAERHARAGTAERAESLRDRRRTAATPRRIVADGRRARDRRARHRPRVDALRPRPVADGRRGCVDGPLAGVYEASQAQAVGRRDLRRDRSCGRSARSRAACSRSSIASSSTRSRSTARRSSSACSAACRAGSRTARSSATSPASSSARAAVFFVTDCHAQADVRATRIDGEQRRSSHARAGRRHRRRRRRSCAGTSTATATGQRSDDGKPSTTPRASPCAPATSARTITLCIDDAGRRRRPCTVTRRSTLPTRRGGDSRERRASFILPLLLGLPLLGAIFVMCTPKAETSLHRGLGLAFTIDHVPRLAR